MTVQEVVVCDVADVVALLLTPQPLATVRWFRGQACHTWKLQPSLPRKIAPCAPDTLMRREQRLITLFRQRSLPFWPEGYPQTDWEHLFAMQHFGVPTRLLDWTENLLVGLFFAATDHDEKSCSCGTGACKPALWVLNPAKLNRENPRLAGMDAGIMATSDPGIAPWAPGVAETLFAPDSVAIFGTHNSARIVAQQGTFTVSGKKSEPLEESPSVQHHTDVLFKLTFDCDRMLIMGQLRALGVSRSAVYPDLTGLSQDIIVAELG